METQTLITTAIGISLAASAVVPHWLRHRTALARARQKLEKTAGTEQSVAIGMHPQISLLDCIGCGTCVQACPESDVLGLVNGQAALIHASKCVGHGLCAEQCPVGAITLGLGAGIRNSGLPELTEYQETSVPGIYIAGELGGIGLIKNAITQGVRAVEHLAASLAQGPGDVYDAIIVGAGPAGLAAALTAQKHGLRYALLEQGDIGGTILQYPRRKIVLTSPVELPLYGKLKFTETSKETLLELWQKIIGRTGLHVRQHERVTQIQPADGLFQVGTSVGNHLARRIVLALGRRGTPRKLGVPGEDLPKVAYRLIEAESYQDCDVLVVGGGDSAVEAALALAGQKNNRVTLSYRKAEFTRIKDRNEKHLQEAVRKKTLTVEFSSEVQEIRADSVSLQCSGGLKDLANQYVFIFAGGELPYDFLRKIGIRML